MERLTDRRVNVNIIEIKNPDLNAQLVASGIAEQLRRRASFRRTIKQRCEATMNAGAKGVKVSARAVWAGRKWPAPSSRCWARFRLQTLDADVDYGLVHAKTTYGVLGVKVWIYRGMKDQAISDEVTGPVMAGSRRRGGGGGFGGGPGGSGGPGRGRGGGGGGGRGGRGGGRGGRGRGEAGSSGGEAAPQAPAEGGGAPQGGQA